MMGTAKEEIYRKYNDDVLSLILAHVTASNEEKLGLAYPKRDMRPSKLHIFHSCQIEY